MNKLKLSVIGIILLIFGIMAYGLIPSSLEISAGTVRFNGMYGIEIPLKQIQDVRLENSLPKKLTGRGLHSKGMMKGTYVFKKLGECHAIVESAHPPFLIIDYGNREHLIINYSDTNQTKAAFNSIVNAWNHRPLDL